MNKERRDGIGRTIHDSHHLCEILYKSIQLEYEYSNLRLYNLENTVDNDITSWH